MAIDDKLVDMLHEEYANIGYGLLGGPQKNMAFRLLKGYPQFFVKLIAIGLLSLAAPRIKGAKDYWMEEETRAIIPIPVSDYQSLIKGYGDEMIKLGLSPAEISKIVANEYGFANEMMAQRCIIERCIRLLISSKECMYEILKQRKT